jgi:hypothetical protein
MNFYSPSAYRVEARPSASKVAHIVISSDIYSDGEGGVNRQAKGRLQGPRYEVQCETLGL